jgi:uncharacterized lipoprotein YajG
MKWQLMVDVNNERNWASMISKKEGKMKKMLLMLCGAALFAAGCQPTIATMSVTETIGPDGEKTVSTTKCLSQHISHTQTTSTDMVLEKFK